MAEVAEADEVEKVEAAELHCESCAFHQDLPVPANSRKVCLRKRAGEGGQWRPVRRP